MTAVVEHVQGEQEEVEYTEQGQVENTEQSQVENIEQVQDENTEQGQVENTVNKVKLEILKLRIWEGRLMKILKVTKV